jgi:hypothetical protein
MRLLDPGVSTWPVQHGADLAVKHARFSFVVSLAAHFVTEW